MKRWLAWASIVLLVLPLVCAIATTVGVNESYAEMVHGSMSTLMTLWALGWLRSWKEIVA